MSAHFGRSSIISKCAAHDQPALVVTSEWLFQHALFSGHKWPTYKKVASSSVDVVYKAFSAWGVHVNNTQCRLGTHTHILSIQQDRQCPDRQLVLLGETIVLTLVQIQLHLAVCVLAHSELLMRAAGTYQTSRCRTKGQINTV